MTTKTLLKLTALFGVLSLILVFGVGCSGKQSAGKAEKDKPAKPTASSSSDKPVSAKEDKPKDDKSKENESVKVVANHLNLAWWDTQGKPRFKAVANRISGDTVSGTASLYAVDAKMYDKGQLVGKMIAPLITANEKTGIITATGGVTIVSLTPGSNMKTIKAARVRWFTKQNKIWGDGGISAEGPTTSLDASAFSSDSRMRKVEIYADPSEAQAAFGRR